MGVDSCNVFGKRPLLVIFTIVWFIAASCMFFFFFFLSLLQTESYLKAYIFFILKPFFGGPQALILPIVGKFNKLCKIGHRSEKNNNTKTTLWERTMSQEAPMELISFVLTPVQLQKHDLFQFIHCS